MARRILICIALIAAICAAFLSGVDKGLHDTAVVIRERVQQKASVCHQLRAMGVNALAQAAQDAPHKPGTHFDMIDCAGYYSILGETEEPIAPIKGDDGATMDIDLKASPSLQ